MAGPLQLRFDFAQHRRMRGGIDFALQDLAGAGDGELRHLPAQILLGARNFLLDLRLGRRDDAVSLGLRLGLRAGDGLAADLLALRDDFVRLGARLGDQRLDATFGARQVFAALLAGGKAVCDGLLPRIDCERQRRPDVLGAQPDEDRKCDRLHDDREIDVHAFPLCAGCRKDVTQAHWMTESSGLLNANNIAMPRPMMNDASIRPSSRNTLPCSCGISSGWRAAPSRNREHMMPTPTQAPNAPSPIIRPMPMPVDAWIWASSCSLSMSLPFLCFSTVAVERMTKPERINAARAPLRCRRR